MECTLECQYMRIEYDCKTFGCDHHAVGCPNAHQWDDEEDE